MNKGENIYSLLFVFLTIYFSIILINFVFLQKVYNMKNKQIPLIDKLFYRFLKENNMYILFRKCSNKELTLIEMLKQPYSQDIFSTFIIYGLKNDSYENNILRQKRKLINFLRNGKNVEKFNTILFSIVKDDIVSYFEENNLFDIFYKDIVSESIFYKCDSLKTILNFCEKYGISPFNFIEWLMTDEDYDMFWEHHIYFLNNILLKKFM